MSEYPEHDKLHERRELHEFAQTLGAYLDTKGVRLCELRCDHCGRSPEPDENEAADGAASSWCPELERWHEDVTHGIHWQPVRGSINDQLSPIFGIDQAKLEAEKEQMLDELRAVNAEVSA